MNYEKAKEFKRKYIDTGILSADGEVAKAFFEVIPELAESEDEKIIRAIIGILKNSNAIDINVSQEKMVAWLERQKANEKDNRMAPIYEDKDSFEQALDKAWKYYDESGARKVDSFEDDYTECAYAKGFREGFLFGLEKQKEQKPLAPENDFVSKWSEEDRRTIDRACVALRAYANGNLPEILPSELLACADRLQSIIQQPKQEWSEEDEATRQAIIEYLDPESGSSFTMTQELYKWVDWLKFLPLKLKKENEDVAKLCSHELSILEGYIISGDWSERHKERALDIIKSLCPQTQTNCCDPKFTIPEFAIQNIQMAIELLEEKKYFAMANCLKETLDFLSKRYWKPNKKQMEALESCGKCSKEIHRLYLDLKKL